VSLQYEPRLVLGRPPSPRGYHATVLADSRLFVFGGFNGQTAFDDVHILELAAGAYLPQVTSFTMEALWGFSSSCLYSSSFFWFFLCHVSIGLFITFSRVEWFAMVLWYYGAHACRRYVERSLRFISFSSYSRLDLELYATLPYWDHFRYLLSYVVAPRIVRSVSSMCVVYYTRSIGIKVKPCPRRWRAEKLSWELMDLEGGWLNGVLTQGILVCGGPASTGGVVWCFGWTRRVAVLWNALCQYVVAYMALLAVKLLSLAIEYQTSMSLI